MESNSLAQKLQNLVPNEGVIADIIPRVDLFRISASSPRTPQHYEPGILILAQGHKKIFIGDEVFKYDPMHYLVLSVPLPLECETTAPKAKPLLGLKIKVDAAIIGEVLLGIEEERPTENATYPALYAAPLNDALINASMRLLDSLRDNSDGNFLGPMCVKEIIYRVLRGKNGHALKAMAIKNQKFFQIARILNRIHDSYSEKINLDALAQESGMSISSFHTAFKSVTNITPLQYIKSVRLHKARMLMKTDGLSAYKAAFEVGYESPSQFNREYKRLFGETPAKDVILSGSL
jgi:AraC-like DNA-binding protein